jgi:hypothetical protein
MGKLRTGEPHGNRQDADGPTAEQLQEPEDIIGENGLLKELTKAI